MTRRDKLQHLNLKCSCALPQSLTCTACTVKRSVKILLPGPARPRTCVNNLLFAVKTCNNVVCKANKQTKRITVVRTEDREDVEPNVVPNSGCSTSQNIDAFLHHICIVAFTVDYFVLFFFKQCFAFSLDSQMNEQ